MEICTIGGFEEVGKNMTAVKVGEEVYIFDIGFYLPGVIELQEDPDEKYNIRSLRRVGGIPDDRVLDNLGWRKKVKAIFISHAHLDHVGGVQFLAHRYPGVPIYGTPFTIEVLRSLISDSGMSVSNPIKKVDTGVKYSVKNSSQNIKFEFVHTTHSTIDSAFVVLHTPEGAFFYALDLKFDNHPTMGLPPDYKRFGEIGKRGVKALMVDALYSYTEKKPGGEKVAQHLLEDAFSKVRSKKGALFITTFSSHIERLNNIVKIASGTRREIVLIGRSLARYVECSKKIGKCPFRNNVKILKYRRQVNSFLRKVENNREKYLVICTGHQGEKNSILDRISKGSTPFNFRPGDNLIFSSSVIPTEVNIIAREKLDKKLRGMGVKIQTDVHVHGHGSREDMRELIEMLKPEHIIPAHGDHKQEEPLIGLAKEYNYSLDKNSHLVSNGDLLKL
ncbi:ribonuclease J [Candidatus Pacearchaeota archaeon ex4484_71]|nr:MAG: ribonuclease J [Candidatus Pacearchaeota archaeon ex4484_71]